MAFSQTPSPHIAILPSPGIGHLIPLLEFAKRLVHLHNFTFTFIIPSDGSPSTAHKSIIEALPSSIDSLFLPPVSFDDLPDGTKVETIIALTVARSLPSIRTAFESLVSSTRLVALVVDLFGTDAFDVATEFNVPSYIFYPASSIALSLFLYLPKLDETVSCEYTELPDPIKIPGCIPISGPDLHDPIKDRKNDAYKWVLHHAKRYRLAEAIMANSFLELEPGALKALQEVEPGKPPVYQIGPIVNMDPGHKVDKSGCLKWLDTQPCGSVLFISFGSGGSLSNEQVIELAFGLEMSEQRFLWVAKSPNDKEASATYFSVQNNTNPLDFLPKGFIERTQKLGLVVPSWAPQPQVLSHGSTGGFLTHCGWNSTLESAVNGVPLIAWPLFAEQKMNAVVLSEETKVALKPKFDKNGIVGREEIARIVRVLMEGEEGKMVRSRMKDMKEAALKTLSENGASTNALSNLALKWKNTNNNH